MIDIEQGETKPAFVIMHNTSTASVSLTTFIVYMEAFEDAKYKP